MCVGSRKNLYFSFFRRLADFFLFRCRHASRQNSRPNSERREEFPEGREMLLRQYLGGSHDERRKSVLRREVSRRRRDHCFSRAYVSLKQPVHREAALHISHAVRHGSYLRVCRCERERVVKRVHVNVRHDRSRKRPPAVLHLRQSEPKRQKLLKDQTPPCRFIFAAAFRKVYTAHCLVRAHERVFRDDLGRERFRALYHAERVFHVLDNGGVGKPFGKPIFRDQSRFSDGNKLR